MGGFVANFAKQRKKAKLVDVVMGYYNGSDLPTYDHLAREFAVCDRWYCSVPGRDVAEPALRALRPGGRQQGPEEGAGLRRALVRAPPRVEQGLVALVHARRRDAPLHRQQVPGRLPRQVRLLRPPQHPRAAQLHGRREGREAAGRLVDRPELRRRLVRRAGGIERRPSALGHQGRPGARAEDVHGARQQPELEEDDARGHLRRARRVLRPRAPAGRARRPARVPDVRRPRARVRRLAVHASARASRTPSTTTRRSSRRSCSASARRTARSRTWAHGSRTRTTLATC